MVIFVNGHIEKCIFLEIQIKVLINSIDYTLILKLLNQPYDVYLFVYKLYVAYLSIKVCPLPFCYSLNN